MPKTGSEAPQAVIILIHLKRVEFLHSLGVLSLCKWKCILEMAMPERLTRLRTMFRISTMLDESFGMSPLDTKNASPQPCTRHAETWSFGRCSIDSSFELQALLRGYRNFAWSIPSRMHTRCVHPRRDVPRSDQYVNLSRYCAFRWSANSSDCFCLAAR